MAEVTSGSVSTIKELDSYFRVDWTRTNKDIENNQSTISWTLYLVANNSWYSNAIKIDSVIINGGSSVVPAQTFSNRAYQTYTIASGTKVVPHNNDGTKTFTISISSRWYDRTEGGVAIYNTRNGQASFTLEHIERGKPTASLTISPYSLNSTISGWGVYVKGFTQIDYSLTGTPYSGSSATISNYEFKGNSETYTTQSGRTTGLRASGTQSVTGRVKDSRGIWSNTVSQSISVYDYATPKITEAKAFRSDSQGNEVASGTHIAIKCSAVVGADIGNRNSISSISYSIYDNDSGTLVTSGSLTNGSVSVISNFSLDHSYRVQLAVTDAVGSSSVRTLSVAKAIITFHLAENGLSVGIGQEAQHQRAVEFNPEWDWYAGNNLIDVMMEQGTDSGWTYRKWKSGLYECWKRLDAQSVSGTAGTRFGISAFTYGIDPTTDGKYPITLYNPSAIVNGAIDSAAVLVTYCNPYQTGVSAELFCTASSGNMKASIHVVGRWKQ